jgi:hypothetical protein
LRETLTSVAKSERVAADLLAMTIENMSGTLAGTPLDASVRGMYRNADLFHEGAEHARDRIAAERGETPAHPYPETANWGSRHLRGEHQPGLHGGPEL